MKNPKKTFTILNYVLLVGVILIFLSVWPSKANRSEYPLIEKSGEATFLVPELEKQVAEADLIVEATVVRVLPQEERTYTPTQQEIEKYGMKNSTYRVLPVEFKVLDTIKGNVLETVTLYVPPIGLSKIPEFKADGRFVLILEAYDKGYAPVAITSSYFYVTKGDIVRPTSLEEPMKHVDGMKLTDFKAELRGYTDAVPSSDAAGS